MLLRYSAAEAVVGVANNVVTMRNNTRIVEEMRVQCVARLVVRRNMGTLLSV